MNKKHIIPVIILAAVSVVLFFNTLGNPFMWDDEDLIVRNQYIQKINHIPFLFSPRYWNQYHPGLKGQYRPVSVATLALEYALWNKNTSGYHVTNLVLHIINVLLIYFLALQFIRDPDRPSGLFNIPFIAALLFASHPIHTESVTWIKNRFDLLSLLFFLISLLFFVEYTRQKKAARASAYILASFISFILAIFSKETAITLPLVMILYTLCFSQKSEYKKGLAASGVFLGGAFCYLASKAAVLTKLVSIENPVKLTIFQNTLVVIKTLGFYLKMLILPVNLSAEHDLGIPVSFFDPGVIFSFLAIIIIVAAAIRAYKHSREIFFAAAWIFIALLPSSNIIYLASRPLAEQRLYIPSAGFCVLLSVILTSIPSLKAKSLSQDTLKGIAISLTFLLLVPYSVMTIKRNADWRDPIGFWEKTVKSFPDNGRAYNNLGLAYFSAGRVEEAVDSYNRAIDITESYASPYNNLGICYQKTGRIEEAIGAFDKAVNINPQYADAYNNMANMYTIAGENSKAIDLYNKALQINPDHGDTHNNLAVLYYNEGKYAMAIEHCDRAIELGVPVHPEFLACLKPYRR